jgi:hypothetical protein
MSAIDTGVAAVVGAARTLRATSPIQFALRAGVLVTGAIAALLPQQQFVGGLAVLIVVALLGALMAAVAPETPGAAITFVMVAVLWLVAYGLHGAPSILLTTGLAADLYVFHTLTALCAAMPATARIDPEVLIRWSRHALVTLAVSGVVAVVAFVLPRLTGSLPLELAGLLAVVALTAVPVWLARTRR